MPCSSRRGPRYLKPPLPGPNVVAREVAMLPALGARGFPVLEFEHCTGDLAGAGTAFHVTREVEHVTGPELVDGDPSAGHRLATPLGQLVRQPGGLAAGLIPRRPRWSRDTAACSRPQYRGL